MRIESIILREVGPFDDVRIDLPAGTKPALADVYLLTGPNGCGKSTVLYALAATIAMGASDLGRDLIRARLRTRSGVAAVRAGAIRNAVAWPRGGEGPDRKRLADPFGGDKLVMRQGLDLHEGYFKRGEGLLDLYVDAVSFRPVDQHSPLEWAAFAYAGTRSVGDGAVDTIQEPKSSPFENSLDFGHSTDAQLFASWIVNQEFRRLKAKDAGNATRAEELGRSIHDIERIIGEITEQDFAFVMSESDNNVRVRWNGAVITMDLLPAGLQSIVSWIADLLMRLDRIPWVDNTPPMKRSFLLLLDEIDIHLHPAWQRKVIPIVQRMFPKAQIIATTHSPFVVMSADDAHIVRFAVTDGVSRLQSVEPSQIGVSYSAVLREFFGITSDFDVDTERLFAEFHTAKASLLQGTTTDRAEVDARAAELSKRGEEVAEVVSLELRQLARQLDRRNAG
jgi:energy-coupling factor transporter ATP-binding protein EcfA2